MEEKLKGFTVYLPEAKHIKIKKIAIDKRQSLTKTVEDEIDRLIKREEKRLK